MRLYSRPGNDLSCRFPLIGEALARLRSRSCIVDGEAVACDDIEFGTAAGEALAIYDPQNRGGSNPALPRARIALWAVFA